MTTLRIGSAHRARTGEPVCGDVGTVIPTDTGVLLCLADGLGHGESARAAAEAAGRYARERASDSLGALLRGIDRALSGGRGAAVSLLALALADRTAQFTGVGNVELRAVARTPVGPPTMPGIAGRGLRTVRVWDFPIADGDLFVLASDGISTRFELEPLMHLAAQAIADEIVLRHHKAHDDASCLVVRVGS